MSNPKMTFSGSRQSSQETPFPSASGSKQKHSLDSLSEEPIISSIRRKSVFAEAYNPEEDEDDDDSANPIYPKTDEQRRQLTDSVKNILIFRVLDKVQLGIILDAMFQKVVKKGECVIKQGDNGDNFYIIERGVFSVYVTSGKGKERKHVHTHNNCGSFGELALLYNMPRTATVQADTDGVLWALDRQTFRCILLKSAYQKRKMYETLIETVPMLKALEPYERMNLADALVPRTYSDGERIIKQGDSADGMFFVEEGLVRVTCAAVNGPEMELRRVSKGGYFGERALITHKARIASVYAVGNVKVAFLDVEAFERLLGPCMSIMRRNINDLEEQLVKIFGTKEQITDIR
ncbi:cAMP-dependent protein kinase type II regulatory subunit [Blattella germanica]|nr:cAMP-dependent protein kinase type II regulatory subunit [Blattella germanica]